MASTFARLTGQTWGSIHSPTDRRDDVMSCRPDLDLGSLDGAVDPQYAVPDPREDGTFSSAAQSSIAPPNFSYDLFMATATLFADNSAYYNLESALPGAPPPSPANCLSPIYLQEALDHYPPNEHAQQNTIDSNQNPGRNQPFAQPATYTAFPGQPAYPVQRTPTLPTPPNSASLLRNAQTEVPNLLASDLDMLQLDREVEHRRGQLQWNQFLEQDLFDQQLRPEYPLQPQPQPQPRLRPECLSDPPIQHPAKCSMHLKTTVSEWRFRAENSLSFALKLSNNSDQHSNNQGQTDIKTYKTLHLPQQCLSKPKQLAMEERPSGPDVLHLGVSVVRADAMNDSTKAANAMRRAIRDDFDIQASGQALELTEAKRLFLEEKEKQEKETKEQEAGNKKRKREEEQAAQGKPARSTSGNRSMITPSRAHKASWEAFNRDFRTLPIVSDDENGNSIRLCDRCIYREWKRGVTRTRSQKPMKATPEQKLRWDSYEQDRIVTIDNDEYVDRAHLFGGEEVLVFDLNIRIACYCRHHDTQSYRLVFTIKDYAGMVVAQEITDPITIAEKVKKAEKETTSKASTQLH